MQVDIVQVGNSKGIRIPASVLKQCGMDAKLEMQVIDNQIILTPIKEPRQGWRKILQEMAAKGEIEKGSFFSAEMDGEALDEWHNESN